MYKKMAIMNTLQRISRCRFCAFSRKLSVIDIILVGSQEKKKVAVLWHNTWENRSSKDQYLEPEARDSDGR